MADESSRTNPPTLSVIVTIVDGGATLERCLVALSAQTDPPSLEVLVPYDDSVSDVGSWTTRFPGVRFLPMGRVPTRHAVSGHAGQHELFDGRRSFGLAKATGRLIAILEDRGAPRADWARTVARLHAELPHAVIGGGVENACDQPLNWAVFFCDFGRYQPPFEAGARDYVTDINVCYKRAAIEATRNVWGQRYHETTVHWALLNSGETLFLSPEPVVEEFRLGLSLRGALRERVTWGRLFAYTRVRDRSTAMRLGAAVLTPLLPFVLFARQFRLQLAKRAPFGRFLRATPAMFLLLVAWSVGEFVGYTTGKA